MVKMFSVAVLLLGLGGFGGCAQSSTGDDAAIRVTCPNGDTCEGSVAECTSTCTGAEVSALSSTVEALTAASPTTNEETSGGTYTCPCGGTCNSGFLRCLAFCKGVCNTQTPSNPVPGPGANF